MLHLSANRRLCFRKTLPCFAFAHGWDDSQYHVEYGKSRVEMPPVEIVNWTALNRQTHGMLPQLLPPVELISWPALNWQAPGKTDSKAAGVNVGIDHRKQQTRKLSFKLVAPENRTQDPWRRDVSEASTLAAEPSRRYLLKNYSLLEKVSTRHKTKINVSRIFYQILQTRDIFWV